MTIFVDTSAFVALNVSTDSQYDKAVDLVDRFREKQPKYITSNYIIAEAITIISQKASHQRAIRFYEEDLNNILIIRISPETEIEAFETFKKLTSKNVSFVDCTSFALMREMNIKKAFSFDTHFKQQGFKLL